MSPQGGDGSRTTLRVALVPFAKTVSPRDGLQALGNHCEPVRKDCGPEGCPIRNHREPQNPLICKPASYCLQAATTTLCCNTTPNFGASVVRIIRLADVRAVHLRGSRQPGYLLA